MFSKDGLTFKSGYLYIPDEVLTAGDLKTSPCLKGDIIAPGTELEKAGIKKGDAETFAFTICDPPSAGSTKALCKYENMNIKARVRRTILGFRNCPFDSCTFKEETISRRTITTTGEVKASITLFEKVGLEASITNSLENEMTYTTATEANLTNGKSAHLVGVTVVLTVTIGSVKLSGFDVTTYDPNTNTFTGACQEDKYTSTKPITNSFLVKSKTTTLWLNCTLSDPPAQAPAKRDLEANPEDACFYYDADGNSVEESCPV
ncbi:hypothetical protein BG011_001957 [Mortierella polycephala]|uniref:Uncharacterized protein n=1 Tax=Mortierella polycephala TaxID=41804 RepID=A0A9P6TUG2_9FUNG|nr:hypothetical protein BG011_001957 [Mortierella polycephala]